MAIGSVVLRARAHADEVLVIDDGSSDATARVAEAAGARVIRHQVNRGKGGAYQTLWKDAQGFDALVVIDGDGQHDADEIPLVLNGLEGADMVIGARWGHRTQMPLWRRAGKRVLDLATAAGGAQVTDSQSGFRAYGPKALQALAPRDDGFSIESQMLNDAAREGLRIAEVPIHCRYDVGQGKRGAVGHASGVLNEMLIQIGILHPLLFIGLPGFVLFASGLGIGAWSVYLWQVQQAFAPAWVLLSMLAIIVGLLAMFMSLVFNVLPRSVRRAMGEHPGAQS